MTRIGVLALQGGFAEHVKSFQRLGVEAIEVRLPEQLDGLDGLVLPGGESSTIGKLLVAYNLLEPVAERIKSGFPVWGTCAGMILLADRLDGPEQPLIGALDICVQRNAFGRQVDSFEQDLQIEGLDTPFHAVFIRAPLVEDLGSNAKAIATLPDGRIVGVQQGHLMGTAFHPELTGDDRVHQLFVDLVEQRT